MSQTCATGLSSPSAGAAKRVPASKSESFCKRRMFLFVAMVGIMCLAVGTAHAQYSAPRIFFSDLQSGPTIGGPNNAGAIVTIYGKGFGTTQGTSNVTIGGGAAARYLLWSDGKVAFQLGAAAATGNIVAHVAGINSNGVSFTVRSGKLYFVSTTGSDNNTGSYSSRWRTLVKARKTIAAGDIVYAMNGVTQTALDDVSASLALTSGGTSGFPKAIIAYPGATVSIGSATAQPYGIRVPDTSTTSSYWVLGGLTIRGGHEAVTINNARNWRIVGNDISCPNGFDPGACVDGNVATGAKLLGNRIHDSGSTSSASISAYDSIKFSNSSSIEIGWNEVANTVGCNAVDFDASSTNQYNLNVHHNLIHDARCDAIRFGAVDPSKGVVQAHDNVIYRAGTGPAPGGIESSYACVNAGTGGTGAVQVLNNTMYDCGARANNDSGAIATQRPVTLTDNIVYPLSGEQHFTPRTDTSLISGSNNLLYQIVTVPSLLTSTITANPNFADIANHDFHLLSSSPAIDAGKTTSTPRDYDLVPRPQGSAYDIGAFEFSGATTGTAQIVSTPSSLSFGNVSVGSSSTKTLTIQNTGTAVARITNTTINNAAFKSTALPATLAAGQSASCTVTFTPTAAGAVTATETIVSNAANSPTTVSFTGAGTTASAGTLTTSATTLNFGSVPVGSSATQTVTATASVASVTISQASITGTGFSVSGPALPATLAVGQSVSFTLTFAPTSASTVTGSLNVVSNATNTPATVTLSGTGASVPVPVASLSPTSLTFGSQLINTASSTQTVTLSNTGNASLSISGIAATGDFAQTNTCGTSLAAGATCTVSVTFKPTLAGTRNGAITVTDNASGSPHQVALSGTGVAATAHSVTLNWDASPSTGVAGYNVYRGTQTGGPYTKINGSLVVGLTYLDSSVVAGARYFYVVTAVDSKGVESVFSTELPETIPTP